MSDDVIRIDFSQVSPKHEKLWARHRVEQARKRVERRRIAAQSTAVAERILREAKSRLRDVRLAARINVPRGEARPRAKRSARRVHRTSSSSSDDPGDPEPAGGRPLDSFAGAPAEGAERPGRSIPPDEASRAARPQGGR